MQGFGKVVTLDMQGAYKYETDFVEKGGTVATRLASMLCYPVVEKKREAESKSI